MRAPPPVLYSLGFTDRVSSNPNIGIHLPFFSSDAAAELDTSEDALASTNDIDSDTAAKLDLQKAETPSDAHNAKQRRKKISAKKGGALGLVPKVQAIEEIRLDTDFSSDAYFGDLFSDLMMPDSADPFMTDDTLFLDSTDDFNMSNISPMAGNAPIYVKNLPTLTAVTNRNQASSVKLEARVTNGLVKGTTDDAKKLFVDEDWFDGLETTWAISKSRHAEHDGGKHITSSASSTASNKSAVVQIDQEDLKLIIGTVPPSTKKARALIHVIKKSNEMGGPMMPVVDPRRTGTPELGYDASKKAYRRKAASSSGNMPAELMANPQYMELMRRHNLNKIRTNGYSGFDNGGEFSGAPGGAVFLAPGVKTVGKSKGGKRSKVSPVAGNPALFSSAPVGTDGYNHPPPGVLPVHPSGMPSNSPMAKFENSPSNSTGRSTPSGRKNNVLASSRSTSLRYKNPKTLESLHRTFWRYENMRSFSAERLKAETIYHKLNHTAPKKHLLQTQSSVAPALPIIFSSSRNANSFSVHGDDFRRLKLMFPRYCGSSESDAKMAVPYGSQLASSAPTPLSQVNTPTAAAAAFSVVPSTGSAMSPFTSNLNQTGGQLGGTAELLPVVKIKREPESDNVITIPKAAGCPSIKSEAGDGNLTPVSKHEVGVTITCSSTGSSEPIDGNESGSKTSSTSSALISDPAPKPPTVLASIVIPGTIGGVGPARSYVSPLLMATRAVDVEESMNQSCSKYDLQSSTVVPEMAASKAILDGFHAMCAAAKGVGNVKREIDRVALLGFNKKEGPLACVCRAVESNSIPAGMIAPYPISVVTSEEGRDPYESLKDPVASLYTQEIDEMPAKPGKVLRATSADPYLSSTRFLYSYSNKSRSLLDRSMLSRIMPHMTDESDPMFTVTPMSARVYDTMQLTDGNSIDIFGGGHTSFGNGAGFGQGAGEGQQYQQSKYKANAIRASAPIGHGDGVPLKAPVSKKRSRAKPTNGSNTSLTIHETTAALLASRGIQRPQFKAVTPTSRPGQIQKNDSSIELKVMALNSVNSDGGEVSMLAPSNHGDNPPPVSPLRSVSADAAVNIRLQQQLLQEQRWAAQQSGAGSRRDSHGAVTLQANWTAPSNADKMNPTDDNNYAGGQLGGSADFAESVVKRRRLEQGGVVPGGTDTNCYYIPTSAEKRNVSDNNSRSSGNAFGPSKNYSDLSFSGNSGLLGNLNLLPSMSMQSAGGSDGMAIRSLSTMPHLNVQAPTGLTNLLLPSLPPSSAASGMSWFTPQWPPTTSMLSSAPKMVHETQRQPIFSSYSTDPRVIASGSPRLDHVSASIPPPALNLAPSLRNALNGTNDMPNRAHQPLSPSNAAPELLSGLFLGGSCEVSKNSPDTAESASI